MCIFNDKADAKKTKIFVAPNSDRTRQITIYSNEVKNESLNNMMILPVPNIDTVEFINDEELSDVFKRLDRPFFVLTRGGVKGSRIYKSGSYKVSIISGMDDFNNLDVNTFGVINEKIIEILNKFYSNGYGFIVCKLDIGESTYVPLAYTHKMNEKLFVPTRHQHSLGDIEIVSHWDHAIYSYNTNTSNCKIRNEYSNITIPNFDFGDVKTINKYEITGIKNNEDFHLVVVK